MVMEVKVSYLGDVQFEAEARGHKIICDQPLDGGGADEGMTPPELLLASLATCAGFYAVQYLRARTLPSAGLQVKVVSEKVLHPARLDNFVITIEAPGVTSEKDVEGIRRSAERCLVKNTMLIPPSISITVEAPAAAVLEQVT
ncbi:MAG: OsmC family protein [Candidatus Solibacter usitatus]|nr:OsmC family protein [Candidatus Solibacter usitatus]